MESHKAGFPPFPHSLEIPSGFPHSHDLDGWIYVFSRLLISSHRHRKGLVTDVSGPQRNACPGTLRDVVLNVTLTSDGNASAVTVQSGPPMLRQAAIDSAKRSHYQSNPQNRAGVYQLIYRYALEQTTKCEHDASYPRVKQEGNVVTITELNVPICDPAAAIETVRFRSAKCLYIWRCGSKAP